MYNKIRDVLGSQSLQMDFPIGKTLRQKPSDYPHIPANGAWNETALSQQEFFKIGGPEVDMTGGADFWGSGHKVGLTQMTKQKSHCLPLSPTTPNALPSVTEKRGDMRFIQLLERNTPPTEPAAKVSYETDFHPTSHTAIPLLRNQGSEALQMRADGANFKTPQLLSRRTETNIRIETNIHTCHSFLWVKG
jgi:hypothetical protein